MAKQFTSHFPTAKIKKMIQMNQDIGKLSNSIPHLLQHSLQIFLGDVLQEVNKLAIQQDCNKLTPILISQALDKLKKYNFLDSAALDIEPEQAPKRKRTPKSESTKQSKPRKKKKGADKNQEAEEEEAVDYKSQIIQKTHQLRLCNKSI